MACQNRPPYGAPAIFEKQIETTHPTPTLKSRIQVLRQSPHKKAIVI
ncbi:MAG: hypothetical protein P8X74_00035 [Reinekea sp.]